MEPGKELPKPKKKPGITEPRHHGWGCAVTTLGIIGAVIGGGIVGMKAQKSFDDPDKRTQKLAHREFVSIYTGLQDIITVQEGMTLITQPGKLQKKVDELYDVSTGNYYYVLFLAELSRQSSKATPVHTRFPVPGCSK